MSVALPNIPVLRFGASYDSLDKQEVRDHRTSASLAIVSQANAGIIKRDLKKTPAAAAALRRLSTQSLIDICKRAGDLFLNATLPLGGVNPDGSAGVTQSPTQYVETLSATSGLPHTLVKRNMAKINTVLTRMDVILRGLTRGLDLSVIDTGVGEQAGVPVSYAPMTDALGVVLPSNSPGVNSIWLPAIALKIPVILKPGREEPWTPLRILHALREAGCPAEALGFYPTDHEGGAAILTGCGRGILFGDDNTTRQYANNPAIQLHGTGRSKVILGDDVADRWRDYLDVLAASVVENGGRSCINASCIITPRHADELADALARRLAAITPRRADDPDAQLSAFANAKFAEAIDGVVEQGLATPVASGGAIDITKKHRPGPRRVVIDGSTFLLPTIVRCDSIDHPLANTEFLFPYASVVEMPQRDVIAKIGPSLVVTAITNDKAFADELLRCPHVDRLNLGPLPTSRVEWDQPHEGNLFEFLYRRRAIQVARQ